MESKRVAVEQSVMGANDEVAAANRAKLQDAGILTVNLISSPGSGKTTLLERTIDLMGGWSRLAVVAGDVQTRRDAERLEGHGVPVEAIETGGGCHLNARQVSEALEVLDLTAIDLLFVENVGNLVCPSSWDLGESMKVVLLSVTEGEDKPLKYPAAFRKASAFVLTKADLVPHLQFSVDDAVENALSVNPALFVFTTSSYTGEGLEEWARWLSSEAAARKEATRARAGS